MEFIQKKTADRAVEHFLTAAADQEVLLAWDRYEGQLPVCGFCEAGLSCRDCLQGPCIAHPFRDQSKKGVCGKDKDILAVQSLLRLVIKGAMSHLDQVADFAKDVAAGEVIPKDKASTENMMKDIQALFAQGVDDTGVNFPQALRTGWKEMGIYPQGIARDLFKASQKLEGGIAGVEETLLWAFRAALLGCTAQQMQLKLSRSVFGDIVPTELEVNLGVLSKVTPNILLYGQFSPVLKRKIAETAQQNNVFVSGVCTEPQLPPYVFSPVTNYGSQEVPIMTGAVDLIVAGEQFVNPSIAGVARDWKVTVVPVESLHKEGDCGVFAQNVVDLARKAFDNRTDIPKDIPDNKQTAVMGFSAETLRAEKVVKALESRKIRGVAVFCGSSNVKYSQDNEYVSMAKVFLQNDVLCLAEGDASVALAKHGFLNPDQGDYELGKGITEVAAALGTNVPPVIDCNALAFLTAIAASGKKALKDYPIFACFPEASRSVEVVLAMGMVAMGVTTYFWPVLPVTGSPLTMKALTEFCDDKFGAKLYVVTKKLSAPEKAKLFLNEIEVPKSMSGQTW